VFFNKLETLTDFVKIRKNLDKAEAQHDFKRQAPNLIKQKVIGYDRPVEEMKLEVVQKSKYFSKEADIVLLCLTHEHGYGNWSAIKHAARRDTRTRFDHLFMSRSEQELSKRVDIFVKSLEKEN
jgi:exonuclease III